MATETSLTLAWRHQDSLKLKAILEHERISGGGKSVSDSTLGHWAENLKIIHRSESAIYLEQELFTRKMFQEHLLGTSELLIGRNIDVGLLISGKIDTLAEQILKRHYLKRDSNKWEALLDVLRHSTASLFNSNFCLLCLNCILEDSFYFWELLEKGKDSLITHVLATLFHEVCRSNGDLERSKARSTMAKRLLEVTTNSNWVDTYPNFYQVFVIMLSDEIMNEYNAELALASKGTKIMLDGGLKTKPASVRQFLRFMLKVKDEDERQKYARILLYIMKQPGLYLAHQSVKAWIEEEGEIHTLEIFRMSKDLLSCLCQADADDLSCSVLELISQSQEVSKHLLDKSAHSEMKNRESIDEGSQLVSTVFHQTDLETRENSVVLREAWREIFATRLAQPIQELYQNREQMPKTYKYLKKLFLLTFKTPQNIQSFFQRSVHLETRLKAYGDIQKDWTWPFGIPYLLKASLASGFFLTILLEQLDLLTDMLVIHDYYSLSFNPVDTIGNQTSPGQGCVSLQCQADSISKFSVFQVSLAVLLLPPLIESIISYSRTSAELYLAHLVGFCCPQRTGRKKVFGLTLAPLIQPVGTKIWAFIAEQRLCWVRQSRKTDFRLPEASWPVYHKDCSVRRPPLYEFTEDTCQQIVRNANLLVGRTRMVACAVEST